jgi:glycosyltransferase involved in cell wall biosynthesis
MTRAMRFALMTAHYPPSTVPCGVGDYTRCLRAALEALGHECLVVTSKRSVSREPGVFAIADRWGAGDCLRVWRLLRRERPDAVILQYTPELYGFGVAMKLLPWLLRWTQRGMVTVTTFHTLVGGRWIAKPNAVLLAAGSQGLVSVHAELSDLVRRRLPWWFGKLAEIPIGANIPPSAIPREESRLRLRRRFGLDSKAVVLGTFGFAAPGKGLNVLLQALPDLAADPVAHLVCIGAFREEDQAYRRELENLAQRLGVAHRIHWTGELPAQEAADLLAGIDVYVVPYDDGASLRRGTLMAGFQAGVPVMTTTPRYDDPCLRHGETLFLVPPQSPKALAQGLRDLLADDRLRQRLREGATSVAGRFHWSDIARRHVELAQRLGCRDGRG